MTKQVWRSSCYKSLRELAISQRFSRATVSESPELHCQNMHTLVIRSTSLSINRPHHLFASIQMLPSAFDSVPQIASGSARGWSETRTCFTAAGLASWEWQHSSRNQPSRLHNIVKLDFVESELRKHWAVVPYRNNWNCNVKRGRARHEPDKVVNKEISSFVLADYKIAAKNLLPSHWRLGLGHGIVSGT